ncbi:MAG: arginine--tRNA ligase [Pirellula sp.]
MQILKPIRERFRAALEKLLNDPALVEASLERIVASRDPALADYQANIAMPLQKVLGKPPLQIAQSVVDELDLSDICQSVSVAGAGYINLRLSPSWLASQLDEAYRDERLAVTRVESPKTIVIDYSSPNVAKPMHVGHIRSTVIGDAISKVLRFLGHHVITDNHLGDWGTQFGMIIYGYKHFCDAQAYQKHPVAELSRLYRKVQAISGYQEAVAQSAKLEQGIEFAKRRVEQVQTKLAAAPTDKKIAKELAAAERSVLTAQEELQSNLSKIAEATKDPVLMADSKAHPDIYDRVLSETAALHRGQAGNLKLWNEFLPNCRQEIDTIYRRLNVRFDHWYGESFYHEMLAAVVEDLFAKNLATRSDGAMCVFLDGFDAPMIVQKQDGAYLYATTDIATAMFREREFSPDVSLYVVDHRQSDHFKKLFAVLDKIGLTHTDFRHISFGTVMGTDGKPFKTRSGSTVGLESMLDEAVARAMEVVCSPERMNLTGLQMTDQEQRQIAETVGLGAIKYADLAHNRTSDYVFDMDKMVRLDGNTSAYIQYSYARIRSILRKAEDKGFEQVNWDPAPIRLTEASEVSIAIHLARFEEMLQQSMQEYTPNLITDYLYELAKLYSSFYEHCPVLNSDSQIQSHSRLKLSSVVAKTLRVGLELLGIGVVERM